MTATNSQKAGTTEDGGREITGHHRDGRKIVYQVGIRRLSRAEELRKAGFVHVTGLPVTHPGDTGQPGDEEHLIQASCRNLGRADANNGKVVIITTEGEVWLAINCQATRDTATRFAKDEGAFVPCSNGESIQMYLLLERIVDPYSDCGGQYTAIPDPKED
ncbi:MAG: hypothetical protein PHD05_01815 [Sphaerochaetaceae bacterium]|nr:hypothetical protein [Sphaerochaetaceae bacterium]